MTFRSVSPPTPEPDQGANSTESVEVRGPSEMWKAVIDEYRTQIAALTTRLIAQRRELRQFHEGHSRGNEFAYARGKREAADQVEELRSALEDVRQFANEGVACGSIPDVGRFANIANVARASLRSLESALPEGLVTPEERRTRTGGQA